MPKANDRIGPYQLIHKLGAGGFGEVWLAQDFSGSSPREVAVKTPHDSEIDLDALLPFEGNDWAELYGAILNENPEPLSTAVPEWLRQVVAKTLTKEPEQRYQSAREMREALRQFERDKDNWPFCG